MVVWSSGWWYGVVDGCVSSRWCGEVDGGV